MTIKTGLTQFKWIIKWIINWIKTIKHRTNRTHVLLEPVQVALSRANARLNGAKHTAHCTLHTVYVGVIDVVFTDQLLFNLWNYLIECINKFCYREIQLNSCLNPIIIGYFKWFS